MMTSPPKVPFPNPCRPSNGYSARCSAVVRPTPKVRCIAPGASVFSLLSCTLPWPLWKVSSTNVYNCSMLYIRCYCCWFNGCLSLVNNSMIHSLVNSSLPPLYHSGPTPKAAYIGSPGHCFCVDLHCPRSPGHSRNLCPQTISDFL